MTQTVLLGRVTRGIEIKLTSLFWQLFTLTSGNSHLRKSDVTMT